MSDRTTENVLQPSYVVFVKNFNVTLRVQLPLIATQADLCTLRLKFPRMARRWVHSSSRTANVFQWTLDKFDIECVKS